MARLGRRAGLGNPYSACRRHCLARQRWTPLAHPSGFVLPCGEVYPNRAVGKITRGVRLDVSSQFVTDAEFQIFEAAERSRRPTGIESNQPRRKRLVRDEFAITIEIGPEFGNAVAPVGASEKPGMEADAIPSNQSL